MKKSRIISFAAAVAVLVSAIGISTLSSFAADDEPLVNVALNKQVYTPYANHPNAGPEKLVDGKFKNNDTDKFCVNGSGSAFAVIKLGDAAVNVGSFRMYFPGIVADGSKHEAIRKFKLYTTNDDSVWQAPQAEDFSASKYTKVYDSATDTDLKLNTVSPDPAQHYINYAVYPLPQDITYNDDGSHIAASRDLIATDADDSKVTTSKAFETGAIKAKYVVLKVEENMDPNPRLPELMIFSAAEEAPVKVVAPKIDTTNMINVAPGKEVYSPFTVNGTDEGNKMFDGDIGTKWCSNEFDQVNGTQNIYTAIKLGDSAVKLNGFRMYTAGMVEAKYNAIGGFRVYVTDDASVMSAGKTEDLSASKYTLVYDSSLAEDMPLLPSPKPEEPWLEYINTPVWPIPAGVVVDPGEAYYNEIIGMVDREEVVTGESFQTQDGSATGKYLVFEVTANCDNNPRVPELMLFTTKQDTGSSQTSSNESSASSNSETSSTASQVSSEDNTETGDNVAPIAMLAILSVGSIVLVTKKSLKK